MKRHDLYILIENMTKQEKIFFKRFSKIANNKKNKHYLSLFKLIDEQLKKQNGVDENILKETFSYLSVEKRYLMDILVKSLAAFNEKKGGFFDVKKWEEQILVLMRKGAYKEAKKRYKKAVVEARKWNLRYDLLCLSQLEMLIIENERGVFSTEAMEKYVEYQQKITEEILNYNRYQLLIYKVDELSEVDGYLNTPEKINKLQKLITDPLLENVDKALSNTAKDSYYELKMAVYRLQGNLEGAYRLSKDRIAFSATLGDLLSLIGRVRLISKHLSICLYLGKKAEAQKQLLALGEEMYNYPSESRLLLGNLYIKKLEFNSYTGAFEENRKWALIVEEGLDKYNDFLPELEEYMYLFLGRAYIEVECYEKALDFLYKVERSKLFSQESIVCSSAKVLILICYYELKWYSNLESMVISFRRQIRKGATQYKFYESLLKYFKLGTTNQDRINQDTLQFFYSEWEGITTNSIENIPFQFFHYREWLMSKIENKPLIAYF